MLPTAHRGPKEDVKKIIEAKTKSDLPASMQPKIVILESDYPRLVNGKVDRQTLVRNYEKELDEVGSPLQHSIQSEVSVDYVSHLGL